MVELQVHCSRCGSADTVVEPGAGDLKQGECLRCEKPFQAAPCPHCDSYRVDGSYGVSGARYATQPSTVQCWDCRRDVPARDPGPEPTAEQ